jgi:hypothetical protein
MFASVTYLALVNSLRLQLLVTVRVYLHIIFDKDTTEKHLLMV